MSASPFERLRRLNPLGGSTCMAGPTIVGLGLAAAVLGGAGLFLFIPLLQSLGASSSQSGKWQPIFDRLLAPVPEHLPVDCRCQPRRSRPYLRMRRLRISCQFYAICRDCVS
ncbi:MAG: hypothetical protein EOR30_01405 [Mesorhizobium sp.]|nr:hypothetical protein EOA78_10595 [Mesorhizobium sp. M5C.F.Cr.IN.023.01.1.1]RWF97128.1 MAG: hypothetical protein EOQ45_00860 [Mesorhizobium sp.]RWI42582.1 MAG: hypothetical protein EOR14_05520 [Mesorhizobium sp.]RWI53352.1 MAG: hypothetical protein EOR15_01025 [Mesorhizobium sp.]RWI60800.1 MAG: hypothetical protein EOR16_05615 [Mesorhizobium sp.]